MRGPNRIHAGKSVSYIPYKHIIKPVSIEKHNQLDNHLVRMITKEYHPFSLVYNPEFIRFGQMYPGYQIPSRKTLTL